ncbi:uncharacterized protein BDZ99DRAFT_481378 [Mytilinidion resinicola]|uniref:Uncharacterized protein n=1 Tax=Mytilinidion resinicola TaxID=574789 RepID=A0A6A6Y5Z7_9PEZI|nr:uncharacterized protein BDZ99DRAFT_481378 [Mytilinidion resinicola]KAF2804212.1 hypothetical protein BDZ99DRAFT_481378 [Mytilinidion resinicola]
MPHSPHCPLVVPLAIHYGAREVLEDLRMMLVADFVVPPSFSLSSSRDGPGHSAADDHTQKGSKRNRREIDVLTSPSQLATTVEAMEAKTPHRMHVTSASRAVGLSQHDHCRTLVEALSRRHKPLSAGYKGQDSSCYLRAAVAVGSQILGRSPRESPIMEIEADGCVTVGELARRTISRKALHREA